MAINITVRDVDKDIFREFKAEAVKKGFSVGAALNIAMKKFQSDLKLKKIKYTTLCTVVTNKKKTNIIQEMDTILYGE